jgi:hypothetical protein
MGHLRGRIKVILPCPSVLTNLEEDKLRSKMAGFMEKSPRTRLSTQGI